MFNLKEISNNALLAGVVAAVASVVISLPVSLYVANVTMAPTQDRQMRLEEMSMFSQGADAFIATSAKLIPRLNAGASLTDEKIAIADASGNQVVRTQSLVQLFGTDIHREAIDYQNAIDRLVRATNEIKDPSQIRDWVIAFDGVVTTQNELKQRMYASLKIDTAIKTSAF